MDFEILCTILFYSLTFTILFYIIMTNVTVLVPLIFKQYFFNVYILKI